MSDRPPDKEEEKEESEKDEEPTSNRIVVLNERDIPFEEERPPNFSPHFAVKVHRVRKDTSSEENEK
ncbi:MAG: hypothetical protein Q6364_14110 [Candidatus Hermodarchaeota archaeon]|nr:hypothetical protein [Candidatus Hermodarchaeota archaeon]